MAEEGTLCINADVVKKAGANHNTTYSAEAYTNFYIKQAEAWVCLNGQYDFVTNYSGLSSIGKELLRDITSNLAAHYVIEADMSGFTSRQEAQTMMDVLFNNSVQLLNQIQDKDALLFIQDGGI